MFCLPTENAQESAMTLSLIKELKDADQDAGDFTVRAVFFSTMKELHEKYIKLDTELEVNISFRERQKVEAIFAEEKQPDNIDVPAILKTFEIAVEDCVSLLKQSAIRYSVEKPPSPREKTEIVVVEVGAGEMTSDQQEASGTESGIDPSAAHRPSQSASGSASASGSGSGGVTASSPDSVAESDPDCCDLYGGVSPLSPSMMASKYPQAPVLPVIPKGLTSSTHRVYQIPAKSYSPSPNDMNHQ